MPVVIPSAHTRRRPLARTLPEARPTLVAAVPTEEKPIWKTIVLLYLTLALIVTCVVALDFLIASLATGRTY
jgi:hypothetical protein